MKLSRTLAAVSTALSISGLLAVACGGSSNNPAGGADSGTPVTTTDAGGNADTGTTSTTDSGAGGGVDAAAFACTLTTGCGTGQECCITQSGSSCIATGGTCAGAAVACTNSTTCSTGDVCCGTYSTSSFTASAQCQAGPCPAGDYQLCATSAECTGGTSCTPVSVGGFSIPGLDACQAGTVDGGSPVDSGETTDAGNGDGGDAG